MNIVVIKTHRIGYNQSIDQILDQYVTTIAEDCIIAITSKIISICEGRVVKKSTVNKKELIKQEADLVANTTNNPYDISLTIKDHILIPSAGIDESNGDDVYILYPQNIQETTNKIWQYLRTKHNIKNLGIIVTDSHTTPLRRGVTGITLSWCGFQPLYSYIGKPDLYNQPLRVTQINIVDALATAAVFMMGEGNEQTPIAIITNAPKISFLNHPTSMEEKQQITIPMAEDLYAPMLLSMQWEK